MTFVGADTGHIEQGSDEWLELRRGKLTASRIHAIMRDGRGGAPSKSAAEYRAELIVERLSLEPAAKIKTLAMQRGNDVEPRAASAYEFYRDADLVTVPFVDHPSIPMAGASPDRLVGNDGLVEFKAPDSQTHIAFLISGAIPSTYMYQMQFQMACTQRAWCDFCSFDDRLPPPLDLKVVRVMRDPAAIVQMETQVRSFLADVDAMVAELRGIMQQTETQP